MMRVPRMSPQSHMREATKQPNNPLRPAKHQMDQE